MSENRNVSPPLDSNQAKLIDDDLYPSSLPAEFRMPYQAIGELALKFRADEGYDPEKWRKIANTGLWGDVEIDVSLFKSGTVLLPGDAHQAAYQRDRPKLQEIVNTLITALIPCETHVRDRLCRVDDEERSSRAQRGLVASLGREVCNGGWIDHTVDTLQPYGLQHFEIKKALRLRWLGITESDIRAAIEEGLRLGKIRKSKYHARCWPEPEIVYRVVLPDDPRADEALSPLALAEEIGISTDTVRRYAKAAGIQGPGPGQHQFKYSVSDALKIAEEIVEGAPAPTRKLAKRFLDRQRPHAEAKMKPE